MVTTFGFSAFLRLILLNTKPQRTELRSRLASKGGGYDFHRSLRLGAHRMLAMGESLDAVLASAEGIVRAPERKSARAGLKSLAKWREENPGADVSLGAATYESPDGNFRVTFLPDFGIRLGQDAVAVHVWNTATPSLDPRFVFAALSLFPPLYIKRDARPDDFAVLSLRLPRLYRLSEAAEDHAPLGRALVERLDRMFEELRDEKRGPKKPPKGPEPPRPSTR
jgi:hypothetical protein